MTWSDGKCRCRWANPGNPRYIRYHDEEWGVPVHDDRRLFEMLILEGFQAGLSWECVLNKQEAFRRAFDDFDWDKVAAYDEARQAALYADPGIIRNRRKIAAAGGVRADHLSPVRRHLERFEKARHEVCRLHDHLRLFAGRGRAVCP